jgi:ribosomal protection tetracycline resistance protein
VDELMAGLAELLPAEADADGPVSASVFKIERGPAGEKIAYARMFSGTLHVRDRVSFGDGLDGKVTALAVFDRGPAAPRPAVEAGSVAKVWGLHELRVGDRIGEVGGSTRTHEFAPPLLEAAIDARDPDDRARLRAALTQLAEQDPLIDVRQDDDLDELSVSLYGEVQKQVIEATLAGDYGIDVAFRETTTICVERPAGAGEAVEILHTDTNPFSATVGLRVEPGPADSGIEFRLEAATRTLPLYTYGKREVFAGYMERYVAEALAEGLYGWRVTDCVVTLTECNYSSSDGPPSTRGGLSKPSDYHRLTPIVLMQALQRAGTVVCEPAVHVRLELPTETIGAVVAALGRLDAAVETPAVRGRLAVTETVLPATRAQELQQQLAGLTGGEGVLETEFAGYVPVGGEPPRRRRTTPNPLNLAEYLLHLSKRS